VQDWEREIRQLHEFFEGWLDGSLPDTDAAFARLTEALAPDFTMIVPEGETIDRSELLTRLRPANGRAPRRITIDETHLIGQSGDMIVAAYTETHKRPDKERSRVSTVVFVKDGAAPNGLRWLHIQETLVG
jgi:hypothetical protein